jgi:hypothetical protein
MGIAAVGVGVSAAAAVAGGVEQSSAASNSASAAKSAASQQAAAEQNAAAYGQSSLGQAATVLSPYTSTGDVGSLFLANNLETGADNTSNDYINNATGYLGQAAGAYGNAQSDESAAQGIYGTLANGINESTLENTPGYQFTLGQGLESTQSSAAARGLASSGAALKGAASYATGLADSTYQNQYNDLLNTAGGYNTLAGTTNSTGSGYNAEAASSLDQQTSALNTNNQNYNQLLSASQLGENAANSYANAALSSAQTVGGDISGVGSAQAAGTTGAANANYAGAQNVANTGSSASSSFSQSLLLNKLLNSQTAGGGTTGNTGSDAAFLNASGSGG